MQKDGLNIAITEENKDKIEQAIKAAEGRATARTISYGRIVSTLETVEKTLGIAKSHMTGIKINVDYWAQQFPGAYDHIPYSTHFTATKTASGWKLTKVFRDKCRGKTQTHLVTLTKKAEEAIIKSKSKF